MTEATYCPKQRKREAFLSLQTNSGEVDFRTPMTIFDSLAHEYGPFDLDAAASEVNTLCGEYYDIESDGLRSPWAGKVWCNPPYDNIESWIKKSVQEIKSGNCETVVLLIPAYTDVAYYHEWIFPLCSTLVFFRSRLRFIGPFVRKGGVSRHASIAVVFEAGHSGSPTIRSMTAKGRWLT